MHRALYVLVRLWQTTAATSPSVPDSQRRRGPQHGRLVDPLPQRDLFLKWFHPIASPMTFQGNCGELGIGQRSDTSGRQVSLALMTLN